MNKLYVSKGQPEVSIYALNVKCLLPFNYFTEKCPRIK